MSDEQLAPLDVAEKHLACAVGLPGSEAIDYEGCLQKLDELTKSVRRFTDRSLRTRGREFGDTDSQTRMRILATFLWQAAGIRYNPAKTEEDAPWELADTFIHGALFGPGGTCATLPVIYTDIGRRLGYPLKLVSGWSPKWDHLFCRWEQPGGERFNIEVNATGIAFPDDDHYREHGLEPWREKLGHYLKSQSPKEELNDFLRQRAFCWRDCGNLRRCVDTLGWATGHCPDNVLLRGNLMANFKHWADAVQQRFPPGFPKICLDILRRRYPEGLPLLLEQDIIYMEMLDNLLKDEQWDRQWWEPLRQGYQGINAPSLVHVASNGESLDCSFHFRA